MVAQRIAAQEPQNDIIHLSGLCWILEIYLAEFDNYVNNYGVKV